MWTVICIQSRLRSLNDLWWWPITLKHDLLLKNWSVLLYQHWLWSYVGIVLHHQDICRVSFLLGPFDVPKVSISHLLSIILYHRLLFKELMKHKYPPVSHYPLPAMSYKEHNAVRYCMLLATYVVRRLCQHLERGSHSRKEEVVLLLVNMCKSDVCRGWLISWLDKRYWPKRLESGEWQDIPVIPCYENMTEGVLSVDTGPKHFRCPLWSKQKYYKRWRCFIFLAAEWEQEETTLLPTVIEL